MGFNIKSIVILSILLLGILFLNYNFELTATESEQETTREINNPLNSSNNENFTWGPFLAISEPIFGQNFNLGNSIQPIDIEVEGDKIYVVWPDENDTNGAGTDYDIFFRFYNGSVWGNIQAISEPVYGHNYNTGDSLRPRIAVENGEIYVIWWDTTNLNGAGTDRDVFFKCNLTGTHWGDIQVISEPVPGQNFNTYEGGNVGDIAVENGKIYVVWADGNDTNGAGTDRDVFYRCNLTGRWEPVQVISEPVPGKDLNKADYGVKPKIEVENGKLYVVWSETYDTNGAGSDADIFYRTNLTGLGWEDMQVISEPIPGNDINLGSSFDVYFEVENGEIYVIWNDESNVNGAGGDYDIFFTCNITGNSWEPVQVISEPVFGQNNNTGISQSYGGGIAVENGNIYVVWEDDSNISNSGLNWDIHYRCNLSGEGWKPIKAASEPIQGGDNSGNCHYPDIAVHNGKAHIVWFLWGDMAGQNSGDDADVFYRWVQTSVSPLLLSSPRVTPFSGNTSTEFNFTVKYFHLNNSPPTGVKVYIDKIEYAMLEVDYIDTNYIDGKDYFFKIKNLDIGSHKYRFWVSNGTKTISTYLNNFPKVFNTPPKIITQDNLTAYEDTYYEVSYDFEDIDLKNIRQPCFWKFSTNASWLKFISNPGTLYGTPGNDDVGKYWVNIIINDTNETDQTNFTLTVIDMNDEPVIITNNVEQIYEDEFYEVDYSATDIDNPIENQLWSLDTNASDWLNLDATTGVINGTPTNDDVGDFWVNVSVDDGEDGTDFTNFTLTVINVNDPPSIITDDLTFVRLGDSYEVDYEAIDVDTPGAELIWSLENNASWLSLNSSTGVLYGIPKYKDIGWYDVNVSVDDSDGGSDWHVFKLTVLNRIRNSPPLITTKDIETAMVDEYYEVDYNATDDYTPGELLIWYLETNASWLSIDIFTGVLNGTPRENNIGWFWVKILVTDGEAGWADHNFTLWVIAEPGIKNHAPELSNPKMAPESGNTKTEFTFSIHYYDPESDVPVFIRLVTDNGTYDMLLKSGEVADGTYKCKITLTEGEHNYYFTASDGINTVNSPRYSTPYIQEEEQVPAESGSMGLILITAILVIILLIVLFLIILSKRKKQKGEVAQEPVSAITTPEISTPVDSQTIPTPQDIGIYTTNIPPEPTDQPSIDNTPSITPSVIPTTSTPAINLPSAAPQALPPSASKTTPPAPTQPEPMQQVQPIPQEQPSQPQHEMEEENTDQAIKYEEVKNENED